MARKLVWVGSSYKDFLEFPEKVKFDMMLALFLAQDGRKALHVKPLTGFSGASVLEIIERDRSGTYRCIYTVKFSTAVYILHAFQKKSHKGITTPKGDVEMIRYRFKQASKTDAEITEREKKRGGS